MSKRVAVVTGASGGLGKEWVKALVKEDVDEVWAIARRKEVLEELAKENPEKVVPISGDLTDPKFLESIEAKFVSSDVDIVWMINNAGMGRSISFVDEDLEYMRKSIRLNVEAVMTLSYFALKHMKAGSHLINVGSQAGRQPVPYETIYAATKAFVNNWSSSLHFEYKDKGIHVMAVTPYWIRSDMLDLMDHGRGYKFPNVSMPNEVVAKAMKDAKKKKVFSVNKFPVKLMIFAQKIVPLKMQMRIWRKTAVQICDVK